MIAVAAPERAAATAWLRPLPPACRSWPVASTVSPGAGIAATRSTWSRLALPSTATSIAVGASGAKIHRPVIAQRPERVVRDLPRMSVGVGEEPGVATPEGVCAPPAYLRAGRSSLGEHLIDLRG